MNGEIDLKKMLRDMQPELNEGEYVFCTLKSYDESLNLKPLASFREREGITVILPRSQADTLSLPYSFVSAWITLTVHSALEAVGLTAAVSQALAQVGISCNIVAAYYHDHLFVPIEDAKRALAALDELSKSASGG